MYNNEYKEDENFKLFKLFMNSSMFECFEMLENMDKKPKNYISLLFSALTAKSSIKNSIENIYIYKEAYNNYSNILKKTITLSRELKLKNSLEISILYTYLLWNGYFSKDNKHSFSSRGLNNIQGLFSLDIMNGKGVCLNYSSMLSDLLNKTEHSSAVLSNYMILKDKEIYTTEINFVYDKGMNFENFIDKFSIKNKLSGNHAFNLILEKGNIYIYDPTNVLLLNIEDKYRANILNGKGEFKLKPYFSYSLNLSEKSRKVLDELHTKKDYISPYDLSLLSYTFDSCMEIINKNKNLLGDFQNDIKTSVNNVTKCLKK